MSQRGVRGPGPAGRRARGRAARLGAAASPACAPRGADSRRARPAGTEPGAAGERGGRRAGCGAPSRAGEAVPPICDLAPAPAPSPSGTMGLVLAAAQDAAVGPVPQPLPSFLSGCSLRSPFRRWCLPAARWSRSAAPQRSGWSLCVGCVRLEVPWRYLWLSGDRVRMLALISRSSALWLKCNPRARDRATQRHMPHALCPPARPRVTVSASPEVATAWAVSRGNSGAAVPVCVPAASSQVQWSV